MAGSPLTATCVWLATPELLLTLSDRFGDPMDSYVNGSQVWLREDGPSDMTIEWRLHPAGGYRRPPHLQTLEVFTVAVMALRNEEPLPAPLDTLWGGLEAFPAYGGEIEPVPLASALTAALGVAPHSTGLVDHRSVGDAWERSGGEASIVDLLLAQLHVGS